MKEIIKFIKKKIHSFKYGSCVMLCGECDCYIDGKCRKIPYDEWMKLID